MAWKQKKYARINWKNRPSMATALGATNLNRMDVFLDEVDNALIDFDAQKLNVSTANGMLKSLAIDTTTWIITATELGGKTYTWDLNLEKIPVSFSLSEDGILTMTTEDGTRFTANIADLIKEYVFDDSGTIDFTRTFTNDVYHVTAIVKPGSIHAEHLDPDYRADIQAAQNAAQSAANSSLQCSKDSKRWAVGDSAYEGSDTDNAKYYKEEAGKYKDAAASSATSASASKTAAAQSETNAAGSATTATQKATAAGQSAASAATSKDAAASSAQNAASSKESAETAATMATQKATAAASSADAAATSKDAADTYAKKAQSYAVGGTGTRPGEDADNAKKYYEQARDISQGLAGVLKPKGTVAFSSLPALSAAEDGWMYNVSDAFTTTADFKEGAGHAIPAGANVYKTVDGKWDVLAGTPVSGVKGAKESSYRSGNVNLTPADIGAVAKENVDAALSSTSENPVQNKAVTKEINKRFAADRTIFNSVSDFPATGSGFGVNTKDFTVYSGFTIPIYSRIIFMNYGTSKDAAIIAVSSGSTIYTAFRNNGVWGRGKVYAAQDNVWSLSGGTAIPANADMKSDTYLQIGNYYCAVNTTASTLTNCPLSEAFTLKVESAIGSFDQQSSYKYLRQTFFSLHGQIVSRMYDSHNDKWADEGEYAKTSGFTMTGNISYKGTKRTGEIIKFIDNDVDGYGNGIAIGDGGAVLIGGGESTEATRSLLENGGNERTIISNDTAIEFYSNCQNGIGSAKYFAMKADGTMSADGFYGKSIGSAKYIVCPDGGWHSTTSASITGAIVIKLPTYYNNTMICFTVKVFDYHNIGQYCEYRVSGYNYSTSASWYSTSAICIGGGDKSNLSVRFGHKDGKCAVQIGEINTAWPYPRVQVCDVMLHYSGGTFDAFKSGWVVEFSTTAITESYSYGKKIDNTNIMNLPVFTPATSNANGTAGLVPAPIKYVTSLYYLSGTGWSSCNNILQNAKIELDYNYPDVKTGALFGKHTANVSLPSAINDFTNDFSNSVFELFNPANPVTEILKDSSGKAVATLYRYGKFGYLDITSYNVDVSSMRYFKFSATSTIKPMQKVIFSAVSTNGFKSCACIFYTDGVLELYFPEIENYQHRISAGVFFLCAN